MSQTLVQDLLILLPFLAMMISVVLVSRLSKIDISVFVPFITVAGLLSFFVLTPILTLPLFGISGIFFTFIKILDKNATLVWTYLAWGRKRSVAYLGIFTLTSWLIFGGLLGTYLTHRYFHLSYRKATTSYFLTLGLSSILTWLVTLTIYYIFGSFP